MKNDRKTEAEKEELLELGANPVLFVLTLLGMASFTVYTLFAGTSIQLRIAVAGQDDELSQQTLLNTSPFKLSQVSGFLTGLLVLIVVGYFTAALINVSFLSYS
ncbi:hypothetical protein COOONC_07135 [Cooperia oncophora]